jgi:hypothetical protein
MAVEEQTLSLSALPLVALGPDLGDVLQDHVEEVVEAAKGAGKLTLALHDDPEFASNALIEEGEGKDLN